MQPWGSPIRQGDFLLKTTNNMRIISRFLRRNKMKILAGLLSLLGCSSPSTEYVNKEFGFHLKFPEGWQENTSARPGPKSARLFSDLTRLTYRDPELSFTVKKSVNPDLYIDAFRKKGEDIKPDAAFASLNPGMAMLQTYSLNMGKKLFAEYRVLRIGPSEFAGVRGVEIIEFTKDDKEVYIKSFVPDGNTPYKALIICLESSAGEAALSSEAVKSIERAWLWVK